MKGFTLIEVIVSAAIMSFIVIATISLFSAGHNVFETNSGSIEMQRMIRQSVDGMAREIRQSSQADIVISGDGGTIECSIPAGINPLTMSSTICYYVADNQLIREHPLGTRQVLAVNVDEVNFTQNGTVLDIRLQARVRMHQRDVSFTIRERVTLRS